MLSPSITGELLITGKVKPSITGVFENIYNGWLTNVYNRWFQNTQNGSSTETPEKETKTSIMGLKTSITGPGPPVIDGFTTAQNSRKTVYNG